MTDRPDNENIDRVEIRNPSQLLISNFHDQDLKKICSGIFVNIINFKRYFVYKLTKKIVKN